jgi:hypothetical protein
VRALSDAREPLAPLPIPERIETLIRSLAGVREARVDATGGRVRAVYVVPACGTTQRGLTRNVQSALMATVGMPVHARAIFIVAELPVASDVEVHEPSAGVQQQSAPAPIRDHAAASSEALPAPAERAAPRIELFELGRVHQDRLQCRVVIAVAGNLRTGVCEAGVEREPAIALAAHATLEALHGDARREWQFQGAADVIIGGQRHVCVSLKNTETGDSFSGAAPVHESVEHAVADAVLKAVAVPGVPANPNRRLVSHS